MILTPWKSSGSNSEVPNIVRGVIGKARKDRDGLCVADPLVIVPTPIDTAPRVTVGEWVAVPVIVVGFAL